MLLDRCSEEQRLQVRRAAWWIVSSTCKPCLALDAGTSWLALQLPLAPASRAVITTVRLCPQAEQSPHTRVSLSLSLSLCLSNSTSPSPSKPQVLRQVAGNGELVNVALNTHGTRAVQKLIETLTSREQVRAPGGRGAGPSGAAKPQIGCVSVWVSRHTRKHSVCGCVRCAGATLLALAVLLTVRAGLPLPPAVLLTL